MKDNCNVFEINNVNVLDQDIQSYKTDIILGKNRHWLTYNGRDNLKKCAFSLTFGFALNMNSGKISASAREDDVCTFRKKNTFLLI